MISPQMMINICSEIQNISISTVYEETLLEIVKQFVEVNNLTDIKMTDSSGSSVVISTSKVDYVCQYYVDKNTYQRISSLIHDLNVFDIRELSIFTTNKCFNIKFDTRKYIVQYVFSVRRHSTIYWDKLVTLNSLTNLTEFSCKNIEKLLWDIAKALTSIHLCGYVHNDASIDNIGINSSGNFCLFDFDGTVKTDRQRKTSEDYRYFFKSLEFNTGGKFKYHTLDFDYLNDEDIMRIIIDNKTVEYFDNLHITY